jgi:hypothetical protein
MFKGEDAVQAAELDRVSAKICELAARQKPLQECSPAEARALRESRGNPFDPEPAPLQAIDDVHIPSGDVQLLARVYRPLTDMDSFQPALVYFH